MADPVNKSPEKMAIFEDRIPLTPKDLNRLAETPVEDILLEKLRAKLEGRCARHGFVVPGSLRIVSRSMGHVEMGRFTGDAVYQVQSQGMVLNPADGTVLIGEVLKKNKMGIYVEYRDAIHVILPRDLHRGNNIFEELSIGQSIQLEIKKSMFQVNDPFIKCVGLLVDVPASTPTPAPVSQEPIGGDEDAERAEVDTLVAAAAAAEEAENAT